MDECMHACIIFIINSFREFFLLLFASFGKIGLLLSGSTVASSILASSTFSVPLFSRDFNLLTCLGVTSPIWDSY